MDLSMIFIAAKGLAVAVVPGVVRSTYGWFQLAMEDGIVTKFEKNELIRTITRTGLYGILGYIGFSFAGIGNAELAAIIGAIVADKIIEAIKD